MPSERRELRICGGRGRRGRRRRSERSEESKFKSHVANLKSIRTTSDAGEESSRLFISKPVCQQSHLIKTRNHHHHHQNAICHPRRLLLFVALAGLLACGPSIWANGQEEEQQQQEQPTPTVIVRGFLNYRTTVDGTVLLFTPDAGSQSPVETRSTRPKPTPVVNRPGGPKTPQNQRPVTAGVDRVNEQQIITNGANIVTSVPPTRELKIQPTQRMAAADASSALGDEWRPVSSTATPTLTFDPAPADSTPSVQAANEDIDDNGSSARSAKRPALGVRARAFGSGSASPSGSINGIRKPGLAQQQSSGTTSAPPTSSLNGQDSAASFQSRLASANTRMRNRLKHKQPLAASSSTSPAPPTQPEVASHLDVASSSEQAITSPPPPPPRPADEHAHSAGGQLPVVGSDEVLTAAISSGEPLGRGHIAEVEVEPLGDANRALQSRAGELRPGGRGGGGGGEPEEEPKVATGELQQGTLSSGPLNLEALFQSDQPIATGSVGGEPSESRPAVRTSSPPSAGSSSSGLTRPDGSALTKPPPKSHNEKLNGWLGAHHNKFVARPSSVLAASQQQQQKQLAANLNQLLPSFSSSLSSNSMATSMSTPSLSLAPSSLPPVVATMEASNSNTTTTTTTTTTLDSDIQAPTATSVSMQTITRTYSTLLETSKTRIVPLVVKSSTAVYTITEDYVMTKMMTAYQTMPAGEFVLPESTTSGAPFDVFVESKPEAVTQSPPAASSSGAIETQEQPISLAEPKTGNNWLHDFTSPDSNDPFGISQNQNQNQQQSQVLALLEQQAREQNMPFGPGGETLEQLASQLDPAALLADGQINLPDLNNPLVLAAAIQNPQLAAVILAAQQLKLKRQQQLQQANANGNQLKSQLINLQQQQQQPASYSTTFTTTIKPSTFTARDTMYTTRLVSFRDGRTVRTRTVSEPGSVVEQVITTVVTETIPVTITIKPTGVLALPAQQVPATASPLSGLAGSSSNQATINNALFATQLAQLLARRQQQLQTSFQTPQSFINLPGHSTGGQFQQSAATPQQLLNLQQMFKQQRLPAAPAAPAANTNQAQFQPNFAQLLQSLQSTGSPPATVSSQQQQQQQATPTLPSAPTNVVSSITQPVALPPAVVAGGPISTTLTSLQVRTYTVHNAFKTIYRTITSTVLVPTVLPSG